MQVQNAHLWTASGMPSAEIQKKHLFLRHLPEISVKPVLAYEGFSLHAISSASKHHVNLNASS
jgi:hypothetical protein